MYKRKIIFLFGLLFLISACSDTLSSVKRGLTGEKEIATDEFLVQKKNPLAMPPDYESLQHSFAQYWFAVQSASRVY